MKDAIAVIIVNNEEILVAAGRAMRKSAGQVMISSVFSNEGNNCSARFEGLYIGGVRGWEKYVIVGFFSWNWKTS